MGVNSRIKFIVITILTVFLYQNCGEFKSVSGDSTGFSFGTTADFATAKAILDNNCVTCHSSPTPQNRNIGLATYQMILDSGSIVPGNSIASRLYQVVEDGSMPQGRPPLSLADSEALRSWIDQGAPDQGGSVANEIPVVTMPQAARIQLPVDRYTFDAQATDRDGQILRTQWAQISGPPVNFSGDTTLSLVVSNFQVGDYIFELLVEDDFGATVTGRVSLRVDPAPAPPPPPPTTTVSFAQVIQPLLLAQCMSCHNNMNSAGNFSVEGHANVISRVTAGNAAVSPLHIRVDNDSMPAGGAAPLNQQQKDDIATWINEGALNN